MDFKSLNTSFWTRNLLQIQHFRYLKRMARYSFKNRRRNGFE